MKMRPPPRIPSHDRARISPSQTQSPFWRTRPLPTWTWGVIARWVLPWMIAFSVAFAGDRLTDQAWSSFWGSGAIVVSVLWSFPGIRSWAVAIVAFGGVWVGFNLLRALAARSDLAVVGPFAVGRLDERMLGGVLTSQRLQERSIVTAGISPIDIALTLIHLSFFVVPFLIALLLWIRNSRTFWRFTVATAICFAIAVIGLFFLPTAPPWMRDPASVSRIPHRVLVDFGLLREGGNGSAYGFEPNALAAFPSVHVAATVLVLLAMWKEAERWRWTRSIRAASLLYAVAMSFGVIYLGEHYLLDVWGDGSPRSLAGV